MCSLFCLIAFEGAVGRFTLRTCASSTLIYVLQYTLVIVLVATQAMAAWEYFKIVADVFHVLV